MINEGTAGFLPPALMSHYCTASSMNACPGRGSVLAKEKECQGGLPSRADRDGSEWQITI